MSEQVTLTTSSDRKKLIIDLIIKEIFELDSTHAMDQEQEILLIEAIKEYDEILGDLGC